MLKIVNKAIAEIFNETIKNIFNDKEVKEVEITKSTNEKFGDFQTNFAMINSKIIGDNPRNIANIIKDKLIKNDIIDKLEVAGPGFINIFLKDSYLENFVKNTDVNFDFSFLDTKGDVIVDYSSPNIAKRMHIAHLRSTIIGESIARIYRFLGYHVISDNHIGDWGTQFGKLIIGYKNWLDIDAYKKNPIEELERVYVKFSSEAEKNPNLEEAARHELKKLQDGDKENYNLWQEFIKVSMEEYDKMYKRLDIHFDTQYGESFFHPIMPVVLKEMLDKKIAVDDDGAKVVFFNEEDNLFPCIVQKKDGAFLYSTSDIATVKYRNDTYNINRLIYLTDERQQDHFKQFFKITEMLGWDIKKYHIWFGIMKSKNGAFSTRSGNIVRLEELLDEAKRRAYIVVNEKNPNLSEEEKQHIAEVVGISSIKYADLSQNRQTEVNFDWDKMLAFDGNTAPYLLYSYARINTILNKIEKLDNNLKLNIENEYERNLIIHCLNFPTTILNAAESFKPNLIADYLYELSKKINSFYNNCPILNQEFNTMNSRAFILKKASEILKQGLALLGIKVLEKM